MEKNKIMQAVILAGGLGTRLKPFTDMDPKPMYEFFGIPFLGYLLRQIKSFGICEVLILLGYLPYKIIDYAGDGSAFGLHITYDITPVEYDTGARLRAAVGLLKSNFLLMYCDNYCPIDFEKAVDDYFSSKALVQLTAYTNRDGYTRNNLRADARNRILIYDKFREALGLEMVDVGYALIDRDVLELLSEGNVNFEKEVYQRLAEKKQLTVSPVEHRYYSIGSWERIRLAEEFFRPKRIVFLDRDGTLNVKAEKAMYIISPEQFVWLDKAKEAVKQLKQHGYTILLITNQPGIARGMVTMQAVEEIHQRMQLELEAEGCQIDKIYMCPHGWDEECFCRKPKPGLLFEAQRELSFNLRDAVLIGDDERDIAAGIAAGCRRNMRVTETFSLYDAVRELLVEEGTEIQ